MALPPLAELADLEARVGAAIEQGRERERAASLLADASTLVRHEAGDTWVDASGNLFEVPDIAVTTCLSAALRGWYNPASIESQQLGAVSVRFGDVWLTRTESERLKGIGQPGIMSIKLTPGFGFDGSDRSAYAPVSNMADGPATPAADWFPLGL